MGFFSDLFGPPVPSIGVREVHELLAGQAKPFLLDVRQPEEFRAGHIAGAKLIPLGELDRRMKEVPSGREVVCICASGHRSLPAVRKLAAAGYSARSMKNGMMAWQLARLPMKTGM